MSQQEHKETQTEEEEEEPAPSELYRDMHYRMCGLRWKLIPEHISYLLQNQRYDKPLAAVIDLDGTILSGHPLMRGRPFPHVVDTLKKLKEDYGMTIFVITARSDQHKEYTEKQLQAFGMSPYIEQIYMWKDADWTDEFEADVVTFKSKEREKIREQGFHILLAVGDRHQDLTHYDDEDEDGNGALNILIENPFT